MLKAKKVRLAVSSIIDNLDEFGLPEGERERTDAEYEGLLTADADGVILSYCERGEGGEVSCMISCSSGAVTVTRRGAIDSVMNFAEGKTERSIYSVAQFKFDMELKTKKIRGGLGEAGGSLELVYDMTVGGAKKACRMKIEVK